MDRNYHERNRQNISEINNFKQSFSHKLLSKLPLKIILLAGLVICALIIAFSSGNVIQAEEETGSHKFYTSIMINPGDSLWSIAQEHIDGHYSSIQEYIDELKAINNLSSDTIHAYEYLLVVYYGDAV